MLSQSARNRKRNRIISSSVLSRLSLAPAHRLGLADGHLDGCCYVAATVVAASTRSSDSGCRWILKTRMSSSCPNAWAAEASAAAEIGLCSISPIRSNPKQLFVLILRLRDSIRHQHQRIARRKVEMYHREIRLRQHTDWQRTFHLDFRAIQIGCQMPCICQRHIAITVLSQPYTANNNGIFQASGPQFARRVPGVPLYRKTPYSGVTVAGTKQWLNPEAFVSVVDPTTGACTGGDSVTNCQFGDSGRNTVRGPHFTDSDIYVTKTIPIREGISFRLDAQMFNAYNHPNFALPSSVEAGVPGGFIPA